MSTKEQILNSLNDLLRNRRMINHYFEWSKDYRHYRLMAHYPKENLPEILIEKDFLFTVENPSDTYLLICERVLEREILWRGLGDICKNFYDRLNKSI